MAQRDVKIAILHDSRRLALMNLYL